MSTTSPTRPIATPAHSASTSTGDQGRLLAAVMSHNAIFSALSGLTLAAGLWGLDSWLSVEGWMLALIGVGLVAFAGVQLWILSDAGRLHLGARFMLAADLAWIVAAVVLIVGFPDALSNVGDVTLGVVTVVVLVFAIGGAVGLRRIGSGQVTGAEPIDLSVTRVVPVSVDHVWAAIADAGAYSRFADGIATSEIVSGDGHGMVRVCTDDRGNDWAETCTLWDEGRRYDMTVDVNTYPVYYRALLHEFTQTWEVEPVPYGTRITLRFSGAVKLGVIGRLAVAAMGRNSRLEAILDAYEREVMTHAGRSDFTPPA